MILGLCAYPLRASVGRPDLCTPGVIDPYIAASVPLMIPALMILTAATIFLRNKRNRIYNGAIRGEFQRQIDSAMEQLIFAYRVSRPI